MLIVDLSLDCLKLVLRKISAKALARLSCVDKHLRELCIQVADEALLEMGSADVAVPDIETSMHRLARLCGVRFASTTFAAALKGAAYNWHIEMSFDIQAVEKLYVLFHHLPCWWRQPEPGANRFATTNFSGFGTDLADKQNYRAVVDFVGTCVLYVQYDRYYYCDSNTEIVRLKHVDRAIEFTFRPGPLQRLKRPPRMGPDPDYLPYEQELGWSREVRALKGGAIATSRLPRLSPAEAAEMEVADEELIGVLVRPKPGSIWTSEEGEWPEWVDTAYYRYDVFAGNLPDSDRQDGAVWANSAAEFIEMRHFESLALLALSWRDAYVFLGTIDEDGPPELNDEIERNNPDVNEWPGPDEDGEEHLFCKSASCCHDMFNCQAGWIGHGQNVLSTGIRAGYQHLMPITCPRVLYRGGVQRRVHEWKRKAVASPAAAAAALDEIGIEVVEGVREFSDVFEVDDGE